MKWKASLFLSVLILGSQLVQAQYTNVSTSDPEYQVEIGSQTFTDTSSPEGLLATVQGSHGSAQLVTEAGANTHAIREVVINYVEDYDENDALISSYEDESSSETGQYILIDPGGGGGGGGGGGDDDTPTPDYEEVVTYEIDGYRSDSIGGVLALAGYEEDPDGNIEVIKFTHLFEKILAAPGSECVRVDTLSDSTGVFCFKPIPTDCEILDPANEEEECGCDDNSGNGVSSVHIRIPTGPGKFGGPSGFLRIEQKTPGKSIYTPQVLEDDTAFGTLVLRDEHFHIRQVISYDRVLTIVASDENGYRINSYRRDPKVERGPDGYYPVKGEPYRHFIIKNSQAGKNALSYEEHFPGRSEISEYTWSKDFTEWTLSRGNDNGTELSDPEARTLTKTYLTGDINDPENLSRRVLVYQDFRFGQKIIRQETGPEDDALIKTWEYYNEKEETHRYGKVKQVIFEDGSWVTRDYDLVGRLALEVTPWKDSPATSKPEEAKAVYTTYEGLPVGHSDYRPYGKLIAKSTKILGTPTERSYSYSGIGYDGGRYEVAEKAHSPEAPFGSPENPRTVSTHYPHWINTAASGKVKQVESSDGRLISYHYQSGEYTGLMAVPGEFLTDGATSFDRKIEVINGFVAAPNGVIGKSTKSSRIEDYRGNTVLTRTHVRVDPERSEGRFWEELSWTAKAYDEGGKVILSRDPTGITGEYRYSPCCSKLEWQRDANGTETTFVYDQAGRQSLVTRQAPGEEKIEVQYAYDKKGRQIAQITSAGELETVTRHQYNTRGERIATTTPDGLTTKYQNDPVNRRKVTILPGNTTRVEDRYLDGRTRAVHGTSVVGQFYDYGVHPETGDTWTKTHLATADSPRWTKSFSDALGRGFMSESPGHGEGVVLAAIQRFDDKGRLAASARGWKTVAEDGTSSEIKLLGSNTLYQYDPVSGEVTLSGQDVDGDGKLTPGSEDQLSRSFTEYRKIEGDWFRVSQSYAFPHSLKGKEHLVSESRQRVSGYGTKPENSEIPGILVSESTTLAPGEKENSFLSSTSRTYRDRETGTTTTTISESPTGIQNIQVAIAGQVRSLKVKSSKLNVESSVSYAQDALGRQISTTDSRTGETKTLYDPNTGRVIAQLDPEKRRSTLEYYPADHKYAGKLKSTTNPDGKAQFTAYNERGQQTGVWGPATQPIAYQYNEYGEMVGMKTFQTLPDGNPSLDEQKGSATTWTYHEPTGSLLKKAYADGKGPEYTYTEAGQLKTRTWARTTQEKRGEAPQKVARNAIPSPQAPPENPEISENQPPSVVSSPLKTSYLYDPKTAQLRETESTDGRKVSYTYNESGQVASITDPTGTRKFSYNIKGQIISETVSVACCQNHKPGAAVAADGVPCCEIDAPVLTYQIDRSYNELGQPAAVALKSLNENKLATVIEHSVEYQWNPFGQIQSVKSEAGEFTYQYHEQNPALLTEMTGPAHSAQTTYEPHRNLLTSVKNVRVARNAIPSPQARPPAPEIQPAISTYAYTNDILGRRSQISQGGTAFQNLKLGTNTVEVAYNDRSEVTGASYRADESGEIAQNFTYAYDGIGNRRSQVTEVGDQKSELRFEANSLNQYKKISENQRPSVVSPNHDADGNLLEDGRNHYTWNSENRLSVVSSKDGKSKVEYEYDYQGRRTKKRTHHRASETDLWNLTSDILYLYDGWNLLAELERNDQSEIVNSKLYTWGRDLSGSLQGAGGVGGLLAITEAKDEHYYPAYDANGNIGQMVDAGGEIAAAYTYDPFGNVTEMTGEYAAENTWRFSTKPVEEETGWLYYGFRYYMPREGRWASRDPIGERGGKNLFGFAGNNGVGRVDRLGLEFVMDDPVNNPFQWPTRLNMIRPFPGDGPTREQPQRPYVRPFELVVNCSDSGCQGRAFFFVYESGTFEDRGHKTYGVFTHVALTGGKPPGSDYKCTDQRIVQYSQSLAVGLNANPVKPNDGINSTSLQALRTSKTAPWMRIDAIANEPGNGFDPRESIFYDSTNGSDGNELVDFPGISASDPQGKRITTCLTAKCTNNGGDKRSHIFCVSWGWYWDNRLTDHRRIVAIKPTVSCGLPNGAVGAVEKWKELYNIEEDLGFDFE